MRSSLRNMIDSGLLAAAQPQPVLAYGTSEGVSKGWETRGRGNPKNPFLKSLGMLSKAKQMANRLGERGLSRHLDRMGSSIHEGRGVQRDHMDKLQDYANKINERSNDIADRIDRNYSAKLETKAERYGDLGVHLDDTYNHIDEHVLGRRGMKAAQPQPKKPTATKPTEGDDGNYDAPTTKTGAPVAKMPMGPQELHVHLHAPLSPQDALEQEQQDPSEDEEDPSDAEQEDDQAQEPDPKATDGSPMAKKIAQTHIDPLGATKKVFGNLTKTSMAYRQAQEEAKRSVIPSLAVLKHVSDLHQLQPAMPAMGMDPNNPDTQGIDPQTGQPMNVNQQPGNMQQTGNPNVPGQGMGNGPLQPPTANPGSATQGAQMQKRPAKMGVPKPGQSKPATKAGNPGGKKESGKSIKLEVKSAMDTRCQNKGRRQLESAAALSNLRF